MKIIKIGAMWCPACIITNNSLNKLKENYYFDLEEIDYDFEDVSNYEVGDVLPVLVFKIDDKEVDRLVGEKSYEEIEEVIKKYEKD